MSGRHCAAEGRREVAVAHLALLGVKIAGNGILGYFQNKVFDLQKIFAKDSCAEVSKEVIKVRRTAYTKERWKTKEKAAGSALCERSAAVDTNEERLLWKRQPFFL